MTSRTRNTESITCRIMIFTPATAEPSSRPIDSALCFTLCICWRKNMKLWALAAIWCLSMGGMAGATEPTSDEADIDRAMTEYMDAFIKGDLEGIVSHCGTPFLSVFPSQGMAVQATA